MTKERPCRRDPLSKEQRSALMGRIRSTGTKPELAVASVLKSQRYCFVSHESTLPGTPDFVLPRRKLAIFVHGCFWHAHTCQRGRSMPKTRPAFWERKRRANVRRDRAARAALLRQGYRVLVLWECKAKDRSQILSLLRSALATNARRVK